MPYYDTRANQGGIFPRLARGWRAMPLRRRLLLTSLIGTVPLILLGIFLLVIQYLAQRKLILAANLGQAQLGAAYTQGWLDGQIRTLNTLADSNELQGGTLADKRALAMRQLPAQTDWDLIWITDASGQEIVNTAGTPTYVGDRPYFSLVKASRQPAVTDVIMGRVAKHPIIAVAYPIIHQGSFAGIVAAGIRPMEIQRIFTQVTLSKGESISLWGDDRRLIARTNTPENKLGRIFSFNGENRVVLSGKIGTALARSPLTGQRGLVGFAPVHSAPWRVICSVPLVLAYAPLIYHMTLFIIAALVIFIASLAWANYSAGLVGRQVALLASSARRIGEGNLGSPVPIGMSGELADVAESLNKMVSDLQVIDRMKSDFLSMVSHELKTPLTGIRSSLELLAGGYITPDHARYQEVVDIADRQSRRLQDMIENLLCVTRLEGGGLAIARSEVSLRPLLQDAVERYEEAAQARHLHLHLEIAEDFQVLADAAKVTLALHNLLDNAMKFTDAGSISICAIRQGDKALVTVTDTGIGFPAAVEAHLFEKFYQAAPLVTRKVSGSGMGLFVTRAIIEANGGNVFGQSRGSATGSTFGFTLEMAPVTQEKVLVG